MRITDLRSTSTSFRGRTTERERGYVLISAIALAILYFALMELMLIDSSRALREAQRFRARVQAATLAESAAELAAVNLVSAVPTTPVNAEDDQGKMTATLQRTGDQFLIDASSETTGVPSQKATVRVQGTVQSSGAIRIDYTFHSQ